MKRVLLLLGLTFVAGAMSPGEVVAQECVECKDLGTSCQYGYHMTTIFNPPQGYTGPGHALLCWPGFCDASYDGHQSGCGSDDLDEEQRAIAARAVDLVYLAVSAGDGDLLRWLMDRLPEKILYEPARASVQIAGCHSDTRIANIPIHDARLASIAAGLTAPNQP